MAAALPLLHTALCCLKILQPPCRQLCDANAARAHCRGCDIDSGLAADQHINMNAASRRARLWSVMSDSSCQLLSRAHRTPESLVPHGPLEHWPGIEQAAHGIASLSHSIGLAVRRHEGTHEATSSSIRAMYQESVHKLAPLAVRLSGSPAQRVMPVQQLQHIQVSVDAVSAAAVVPGRPLSRWCPQAKPPPGTGRHREAHLGKQLCTVCVQQHCRSVPWPPAALYSEAGSIQPQD